MGSVTSEKTNALNILALVGLLIVVAVPFLFVVLQAIFPNMGSGSFAEPFSELVRTLGNLKLIALAGNTLMVGIGVIVLVAILAVPLALARALFRVPFALGWDLIFLIPFMIPPYIATLGWIMSLQPAGYLQQLFGFNLAAFLFTVPGIIVIMTLHAFPVVYFALFRTIEAVGARYGDVGRVFGANGFKTFWRITLPLATPGLAASLLLAFAMTIEEYGTPAALGTSFGFQVLVTGIEEKLADWPVDLPGAASLSLLLVLLSLAAFWVQRWILTRKDYRITGGKPQRVEKKVLGLWAIPVVLTFVVVAFISTFLPLFAILATALSRTLSGGLTIPNLTLQNFVDLFHDSQGGLTALSNSIWLGLATALFTGALGAVSAYAVVKGKARGRLALDGLTMLPSALPGVVVAVGVILAWNQPALPISPYNTALILLLAYSCILLPQPVRFATASFHQLNDNLEAAARVAGATSFIAFRRILLPLILPSLVTSMLLVFAVASRELVASLLVAPVGMQTMATFIWTQFDQGSIGLGMAMSFTAIVITTFIPMVLIGLLRRYTQMAHTGGFG